MNILFFLFAYLLLFIFMTIVIFCYKYLLLIRNTKKTISIFHKIIFYTFGFYVLLMLGYLYFYLLKLIKIYGGF